jgi:hypothetical protein
MAYCEVKNRNRALIIGLLATVAAAHGLARAARATTFAELPNELQAGVGVQGEGERVDRTQYVLRATEPNRATVPNPVQKIALRFGAGEAGVTFPCIGDCDGSGAVDVTEIIKMVNIALGDGSVSDCRAGDANGDDTIDVTEIIQAVNSALNGCATGPPPSPTPLVCVGEIDCGNGVCCPSNTTCGGQKDCCPSGFSVDCGPSIGCCPDGATCGDLGNCCPSGFPVDCGPGLGCCPSGTTCGVGHCF